jgi:hypothetical protein
MLHDIDITPLHFGLPMGIVFFIGMLLNPIVDYGCGRRSGQWPRPHWDLVLPHIIYVRQEHGSDFILFLYFPEELELLMLVSIPSEWERLCLARQQDGSDFISFYLFTYLHIYLLTYIYFPKEIRFEIGSEWGTTQVC